MVMDRLLKLATIKLLHSTVRIGRTAQYGPVFLLTKYDHARDVFIARNVLTGVESRINVADLASALADGIAHPSKIGGTIYHA